MIDENKINSIIKNEEIISQIINFFTSDDEYIKTKIISNNLIKNIKVILKNHNYTLNLEEIELLINSTHQAIEYVKNNPDKDAILPIDENQLLNVAGGDLDPQMTMLLIQFAMECIPKLFNKAKKLINGHEPTTQPPQP